MAEDERRQQQDELENETVAGSPAAENPAAASEEAVSLEERLEQLEADKRELFDRLARQQADFENFRKRVARDSREARKYAEADLLAALLPVLDAFERALAVPADSASEDYRKGVELIYKQLWDTLARAGLSPVEAVGKPFDPFVHHAVERVESTTHPDQEVVAEMQRGYKFKDRLLRPALVKVAVAPAEASKNKED